MFLCSGYPNLLDWQEAYSAWSRSSISLESSFTFRAIFQPPAVEHYFLKYSCLYSHFYLILFIKSAQKSVSFIVPKSLLKIKIYYMFFWSKYFLWLSTIKRHFRNLTSPSSKRTNFSTDLILLINARDFTRFSNCVKFNRYLLSLKIHFHCAARICCFKCTSSDGTARKGVASFRSAWEILRVSPCKGSSRGGEEDAAIYTVAWRRSVASVRGHWGKLSRWSKLVVVAIYPSHLDASSVSFPRGPCRNTIVRIQNRGWRPTSRTHPCAAKCIGTSPVRTWTCTRVGWKVSR